MVVQRVFLKAVQTVYKLVVLLVVKMVYMRANLKVGRMV